MAAINSLTKVPSVLSSNPVLFVPIVALYLLTSVQTVSQSVFPLVGALVSIVISGVFVFLAPLFHGGTIGMTNEAATSGRTSLGSFLTYGKQYYLSVLGAYLLFLAIMIALFVAGGIVGAIIAVGYFAVESVAVLAVGAVVGLVFVALYIGLSMALQFYAHAIVIEEYGAVDSLTRSVAVVRQNLRSVVGYFGILLVGSAVMLVVYGGLLWASPVDFFAEPGSVSLGEAVFEALLMVVVLAPVGAVYLVYSVLFYRSLLGEAPVLNGSSESTDAAVESSI